MNIILPIFLLGLVPLPILASYIENTAQEAILNDQGNLILEKRLRETSESIPKDERLGVSFLNESPYRVDVYWDDGQLGKNVVTLTPGEVGNTTSFIDHSFFVTRHGVKEGLFLGVNTPQEERLILKVEKRNQQFIIPKHVAPSADLCQDRFTFCEKHAASGVCEQSPGWMIVNCCKACDSYLNSKELIDPKKRCSKEHLKLPPPVLKPGDLDKMFDSWTTNQAFVNQYGLEVLSAPNCGKYNATWEGCDDGPWVVIFNTFLDDDEVSDLIQGGEIEGYHRSEDQGEVNALGERERIVSETRTSSNAWCGHKCEALPGVQSATRKIEDVTGISKNNYESFQLLNYGPNQFYRSHHDFNRPGERILTFFLYLSEVEEGGETYFNKLGLSVKPKKGRALVWPSVHDQHPKFRDERMYHEAKRVIKGKKLAANHWIHMNDFVTRAKWGCTG